MATIKDTQAANWKIVFDEIGLTYEQLAEQINKARPDTTTKGFSPTNFYNWRHGRSEMSKARAEEFHALYPQYSVEFLRGRSRFKNRAEERAVARQHSAIKKFDKGMCVERLAGHCGFTATAYSKFDAGEYAELVKDGYRPPTALKNVEYLEKLENPYGETLVLTDEQWKAFVDEVCDYVEMRLNQMMKRGCW